MMGRIIGSFLGRAIGRKHGNHPVAGAVIGAGTLMAARRLFPQRYAVMAAWAAGAYLTKKWADRAELRNDAEAAHAADATATDAGVVDIYAGTAEPAPDGAQMGDALPPALPLNADGKRPAIH